MLKSKIKKHISIHRIVAVVALSILCVVSAKYPIFAQAVTQGYGSDQSLQRSILVRLKQNDTSKVEVVKQQDAEKVYGVVVQANDAPVTISSEGKKVFVATSGHYDVLVSSQNGDIKPGDFITISAIDGVGMKASDKEPVVVGRALAGFDGRSNKISSTNIKDSAGGSREVSIGRVQADFNVAKNPLLKAQEPNLPEALKRASEAIAGKSVNAVRVYVAMLVFVMTTFLSTVLMYGGVRSAIISIGRNPLGKKSIIKGMFQIIIVGFTVFISGIFGVYLLLKL